MAELKPDLDPELMLDVHNQRHTPAGAAILALLKHRLETIRDMLMVAGLGHGEGESHFMHYQGQAQTLHTLIKEIENGPEDKLLKQAEQSTEEPT